jgi:hypothetical protein
MVKALGYEEGFTWLNPQITVDSEILHNIF